MQRLQQITMYAIWITTLFFFLLAVVFSNQRDDFLHSTSFLDGLIKHGLAFYEHSKDIERLGGSDYLPGMYGLIQIAIFPGQILESIFHLDRCTIFASQIVKSCIIEALSLKAVTVVLATAWVVLLQRLFMISTEKLGNDQNVKSFGNESWIKALQPALYVLFFPPVLYTVFLFGAYDGLGAFITLIGSLLYFNSSDLTGKGNWRQRLLCIFGLLLASIGVSAKFFPLAFLFGACIAFSKKWKDSLMGIGIPLIFTIGQILITQRAGGHPMRILENKLTEDTYFLLYPRLLGIVLLLLYFIFLMMVYGSNRNRVAIGSLATLGIFSIIFPSIHWHTQWQLYYGLSLASAYAIIMPKGRIAFLLITLFIAQALAFILITPYFVDNADITMAFSMARREIVPSLVAANILQGPQSGGIQIGWIAYGLTQVSILIILTLCFLRSARSGVSMRANYAPSHFYRTILLVPGVVFILCWYSLVLVSMNGWLHSSL
jgi:hypothetical protein